MMCTKFSSSVYLKYKSFFFLCFLQQNNLCWPYLKKNYLRILNCKSMYGRKKAMLYSLLCSSKKVWIKKLVSFWILNCVYCLLNRSHLIVKRSTIVRAWTGAGATGAWSRIIVTPGCSRRTGWTSIRSWTGAVAWTRVIVIKSWRSRWAPGWSRIIIQESGSEPGCTTSGIVTIPVIVIPSVVVVVRTVGSWSVSRVVLIRHWCTSNVISSTSKTSGAIFRGCGVLGRHGFIRTGVLGRHGQSKFWFSFREKPRICHGGGNCNE